MPVKKSTTSETKPKTSKTKKQIEEVPQTHEDTVPVVQVTNTTGEDTVSVVQVANTTDENTTNENTTGENTTTVQVSNTPSKNNPRKLGRTLLLKTINNATVSLDKLNQLEGIQSVSQTKTQTSFFLTFDTCDNATTAFNSLRTESKDYKIKPSYYRSFFTISGLTSL